MGYEQYSVDYLRGLLDFKERELMRLQSVNPDDSTLFGLNEEIIEISDGLAIAYKRENSR